MKITQKSERTGFALIPISWDSLHYQFPEKLSIKNSFGPNHCNQKEEYDWLKSFLDINTELIFKQGILSVCKGNGARKWWGKFVSRFLPNIYGHNIHVCSFERPRSTSTRMHLNWSWRVRLEKLCRATKGAYGVHSVIFCERGEHVTLTACGNAEGHSVPPALVFKGRNTGKD